jgi:uncharacterized protein (DUF1330 family)
MTAYVVAEIDVTDPEGYKAYIPLAGASVARHGGRYMIRGGASTPLEGAPAKRVAVLAFDSVDAAKRWYESPEYAEALAIRKRTATSRLFIIEGAPEGK